MRNVMVICLTISMLSYAQTQTSLADLTAELEQLSKRNSLVGFGVSIFNSDSVLYQQGFGYADQGKKTLYTTETVQKVASISKLILAVSLMKSQDLGLLHLDDDVNDYLPFKLVNPYFPKEKITLHHLATHTAGLKPLPAYDFKALYFPTSFPKIKKELPFGLKKTLFNKQIKRLNENSYFDLTEMITKIYSPEGEWYNKDHFAAFGPGEKEMYSNHGAALLAIIIEKASDMKYHEFVKTYVTTALKMNDSIFDFENRENIKNQRSSLYHMNVQVPNNYNLLLYPIGGFETSISDFSLFMQAMAQGYKDGNGLLPKELFRQMMEIQKGSPFGHGILFEVYQSGTVGHQGNMLGVATFAYYNKKDNIGYLLFCNTAGTKKNDQQTNDIIARLKRYYSFLQNKMND